MRGHPVAYTLAFLPARHRLARASLNAHCGAGGFAWRAADGELYGRSIALLRPCRERPCGRRAAEQCDGASSATRSFDHLVGAGEQRWRNFEAERPGRLQVDDELEFGGLQDREVCGLG